MYSLVSYFVVHIVVEHDQEQVEVAVVEKVPLLDIVVVEQHKHLVSTGLFEVVVFVEHNMENCIAHWHSIEQDTLVKVAHKLVDFDILVDTLFLLFIKNMESYNLQKCGVWASGNRFFDNRTEAQLRAAEVKKWDDRMEFENKVLKRAELTDDGLDNLHFYQVEGAWQTYPR